MAASVVSSRAACCGQYGANRPVCLTFKHVVQFGRRDPHRTLSVWPRTPAAARVSFQNGLLPRCVAVSVCKLTNQNVTISGARRQLSVPAACAAEDMRMSMRELVERAADLLPHQGILENFIHRNPLQHLESMQFHAAVAHVKELESALSPGERAFLLTGVDPRKRVNEALSDLSASFLDRGVAKWAPRFRNRGFLYFFASLENLGIAPWRKHARIASERILAELRAPPLNDANHAKLAENVIRENLVYFGVPSDMWESSLRSMMLDLRGWAGMFHRMQLHSDEAPVGTHVQLVEFVAVESILLRSSMVAFARNRGWDQAETSFSAWLSQAPTTRGSTGEGPPHSSSLAFADQHPGRRDGLEATVEHALLGAILTRMGAPSHVGHSSSLQQGSASSGLRAASLAPSLMQLYTCIDDRECSLRRHVEEAGPAGHVETFGVAGFFGIPITYVPIDGRDAMVLAPEGAQPVAVLAESDHMMHPHEVRRYRARRRWFARAAYAWEKMSFSPVGSLVLSSLLPVTLTRLWMMGYWPGGKHKLRDFVLRKTVPKPNTDFALPIAADKAASMLARTFRDIGTDDRFAPYVVVLGHGAVSTNNPFFAAYNCGACGGRDGGPNARLLARLANDMSVRSHLLEDHGIAIPDGTVFIGGVHNTTTDDVDLFDLVERLPTSHSGDRLRSVMDILERARGRNALERCNRFLSAQSVDTVGDALRHVRIRSADAAEVRPELNHATNAVVVIGRRLLTGGLFLDRRAFLPSYDPFADDDRGVNLEHVVGPALIVCSGINLEYLFSTIDEEHHGAGSKAPLNVAGNIGVMQGTSGDLKTGLPTQMTEMHAPVRAICFIDAPVARVDAVLSRRQELRQLVQNEWVRCFVRDPHTGELFRQSMGQWAAVDIATVTDRFAQGNGRTILAPFEQHRAHGVEVSRKEDLLYRTSTLGMIASCVGPIALFGSTAMNPHGWLIAACGTALALPVHAFSRRYLHGEHMFGRFSLLSTGLLLGFNLVATAPSLEHVIAGWGMFGFCSTFLIGSYNDRPTARNNATFAFAAYRISDFALLGSLSLHTSLVHSGADIVTNPVIAGGLLAAALLKSSQGPLMGLFMRSMEGPTPASALGYAGLSAHVGVVLLSSTMPLWFEFDSARLLVGGIGAYTAVAATMLANIRADRKGSIALASSATLGGVFVMLSLGYTDLALASCFGHATFRMIQVLRSPNIIADSQHIRSGLGRMPWPEVVPDWAYRAAWILKRVETDAHLLSSLQTITGWLHQAPRVKLSRWQQWALTGAGVVVAGAPFTPISHSLHQALEALLPVHPAAAGAIMLTHFVLSVVVVRALFVYVLRPHRFRKPYNDLEQGKSPPENK